MAQSVLNATLGADLGEGRFTISVKPKANIVAADTTDVAAAVADLVADGATPTEAHVTALAAAWAILLAEIDALNGSAADSADLKIVVNTANVTTANKFVALMRALLNAFPGAGII